jgi:hypothetical protein
MKYRTLDRLTRKTRTPDATSPTPMPTDATKSGLKIAVVLGNIMDQKTPAPIKILPNMILIIFDTFIFFLRSEKLLVPIVATCQSYTRDVPVQPLLLPLF